MAMINCPECNEEVSDSASRCPKCGFLINKPKRSIVGQIIKWSFILFNLLMLVWIVGGVNSTTEGMDAMSGVEQAGTAIGTGIGVMMLAGIWIIGDIILGFLTLLTRPKS